MRALRSKFAPATLLIFVLLGTAGCDRIQGFFGNSDNCPRGINGVSECSQDLATELDEGRSFLPPPAPNPGGTPPCSDFEPAGGGGEGLMFIDITQSMAGFTAGQDYREFDYVMDEVAGALGLSNIVQFGNRGGNLFREEATSRLLHEEATYTGPNNPDYCLYDFALTWDQDKPILYLTDGVLSAVTGTQIGPTVGALYRWLEAGHHIGIMAFKSSFAGRLWSEQNGNWIGEVDVPDRPFYLFVLTRDPDQLADVFDQLSNVLLDPSGSAPREQFGTYHATVQFGERERQCSARHVSGSNTEIHTYSNIPDPLWTMVDQFDTGSLMGAGTQKILASWACDPLSLPNDPSDSWFSGGEVDFTYRVWQNRADGFGQVLQSPPGANFTVEFDVADNLENLNRVRGFIGNPTFFPPTTRYSFWALEMRGVQGPIRQALRDLSTYSDTDITEANRTYRFDNLIENLARFDFERNPPTAAFYMTVQH